MVLTVLLLRFFERERIELCLFSQAQTSRSHKSKNLRGHDEDSGGMTLTPHNPSKPHPSKTLSAPARQNREPPSSSDCNEIQESTLQRNPIKLSVQPERKTDDELKNEADDDSLPSSQQPFQPKYHSLEENPFDEDKDDFISDYQSDPKPARRHTSFEETRIDLELLKEKKRNLELRHPMKHALSFSGPEKSSIPTCKNHYEDRWV